MKLSKLKLMNYRCFGSEEQVIPIGKLTTFIGNNSAGKTAALSALNCLFSENSTDRILQRSDFHLPKDMNPDEMERQSLYVEAVFDFEELQAENDGGEYAIPIFFQHFVVDNPGGLPYLRIRLEATWEKSNTIDGSIDSKECFWGCSTKITAVGDNKQRIMVWAGAVKTIFKDIYNELNPVGVRLVMNHRSAPRLVALQKAMYESLKEKTTDVCVSDSWDEDDGRITLVIADSEQLEAAAVSEDILSKISDGVKLHDICILCKQKPQDYASSIIEELEKHGVRARIETDYQDLIKEPIVDLLIKFMVCADGRKHPNEWTFIEESLIELWGISGAQERDAFDEMQRKLSVLVDVVKKEIRQGVNAERWHSALHSIIDFFGIGNIKAKFPAYKQGTYFTNVITQFEKLFFEEYVAACGDLSLAIENFCGDHSIPIMTIHKSKGLEYNAVYFVGLEDSAFWNFSKQPDEDRCTFFVALSRAKESVSFTFCKRRTNMSRPLQRHKEINEFFDLLQRPGVAEIKNILE